LLGQRTFTNQNAPQETTHFTGRVRLTKQQPVATSTTPPGPPPAAITEAAEIYQIYFHGPSYRVIGRAWREGNRMIGQMAAGLPEDHHPAERSLAMEPRLIELCFHTVGLRELDAHGRAGLPEHVDRVCLCREPDLAVGPLYALVTPHPDQGRFDAEVVDSTGSRYVLLSGYRTTALRFGVEAQPLKPLQAVAH
jgi:hypothetical protein